MKSKYHVSYESDIAGLESQLLTREAISFDDANNLAAQINAEAWLEGDEQGYTVQPATEEGSHGYQL
jgi:hypothetical protein